MRVLKVLLYIILALILILVLIGLLGPKEFHVERSVIIDAPPEFVFPYVSHFEHMNTWGPWLDADPDAETSIEGEDGTEGAKSYWSGNDSVGEGTQTLTTVAPDTLVESHLQFIRPYESEANASFRLQEGEEGTEVTWAIYGENNFVSKIMSTFMNMDAAIGPEFEEGLNNLKQLVESKMAEEIDGYKVQTVDFPGRKMLIVKDTVKMNQLQAFFSTHLPALAGTVGSAGVEMDGMPCGLYYTWDEDTQTTVMAAAVGYKGEIAETDFETLEIPPSRALLIDYYGSYENLGNAHEAMDKYIQTFDLEVEPPVLEEYVTDPGQEPNPEKWLTKIYYFL
jgi:effector-binding domain-containing protein